MEINVSTEQGRVPVTVLHVDGDIDSSTYDAFLSKVRGLIKEGTRYLVIDLARVPYVSSAGLRAIYTVFNDLRAVHPEENLSEEQMQKAARAGTYKSPHLKLVHLTENVHRVFQMGGFDNYIGTFSDLKEAIASF
jgi:anti-anti-sigma factor